MVADPKVSRPAIAMIELIFAIVVMGIVMLSAPTLISVSAKSTTVALQQEGINEAAARINMILTYEWDDNNVRNCFGTASILRAAGGDPELSARNGGQRRMGVNINTSPPTTHTFSCWGAEFEATPIQREFGIFDDIDDFHGTTTLKVISGLGAGDITIGVDYIEKETVRINTVVQYSDDNATYANRIIQDFVPFAAAAGTTNIKTISTTLTSTNTAQELQKSITLRAFSCNLGSYQFHRRVMP